MASRICLFLGLLLSALPAAGLDPSRELGEYDLRAWNSKDGLPQNTVSSLVQTAEGYLLLGTQVGVVRFDGLRFASLGSSCSAKSMLRGPGGRIWAGCYTRAGLFSWRNGARTHWHVQEGLPSPNVQALLLDPDGTLWVGTRGGLVRLRDGRIEPWTAPLPGLPDLSVTALVRDRQGALWIGTAAGLARVANGRLDLFDARHGLPDSEILALTLTRGGDLWVGGPKGAARLRDGRWTPFTPRDGLPDGMVSVLLEDRDGQLWAGTRNGLGRLRNGRFETFPEGDLLASEEILSLFEDAEGSLWAGTDGAGVLRLRDVTFSAVQLDGRLQNSWSIHEDADGTRWIGSDRGLFRVRGEEVVTFTTADGLPDNKVRPILRDTHGDLWVGTFRGLARLREGGWKTWTKRNGLPDDYILSLYEDHDGSLWVGTFGGLARLREGQFEVFAESAGLTREPVHDIHRDRWGNLWVGAAQGLFRFHGHRFAPVSGTPAGFQAFVLHEDRDGTLWAGTGRRGLLRLRDGRVTFFRQKDGLFDDTVYQILEDSQGRFWMSCNMGVFRVRKDDLEAFADGRRGAIPSAVFSENDGMPHTECNGGSQPGALADRQGRLWFPTLAGLAVMDPRRTRDNRLPPPVVIEELITEGRRLASPGAGPLRLAAGEKRVEIRYTALSLAAPEKVWFRYRLDGFDEDWRALGHERTAVYTNLKPGSYVFQVAAGNSDGVWNEAGTSLAFEIPRRFHQTAWFPAVCGGLLLLAGGGAWRLRLRGARQRELDLARMVEERTSALQREKSRAEEASRTKSEFLANMSHEIRTPLNAVLGMTSVLLGMPLPREQRDCVETIRHSGESLLTVISDILDFSKIEAGVLDVEIIPFRLRDCVEEAVAMVAPRAEAKGIALRRQTGPGIPEAVESDATRLRQILINLLDNAVKFTHRGEVLLEVEAGPPREDGRIELRFAVRDTGIGIPPEALDRLFQPFSQADSSTTRLYGGTGLGLAICRRLAERLGGSIHVESEPGRGSTFSFTILCRPSGTPLPRPSLEDLETLPLAGSLPLRILVAEDNSVNQKVALLMLERLGYVADVAGDGFEVLDALRRQGYDLILMDVQMPGMDGLEATRRIRAEIPVDRQPWIVAMTANALQGDREACLAAGMDDFLGKPVLLSELRRSLLRKSPPAAEPPGPDPEPASGEILDLNRVAGLRRLGDLAGKPLLRELVDGFRTESPRRLTVLRDALARGDAAELAFVAHSLKGSSAQLGAVRVAGLSASLESLARAGALEGAADLLRDLERELERVTPALEENAGGAPRRL